MADTYNSIIISFCRGNNLVTNEQSISYRTLGNYDYITVSSVVGNNILSKMLKTQNNLPIDLDFSSRHSCFAVINGLEKLTYTTADFFKKRKSPYMFVSLIQFNYNSKEKSKKQYIKCIDTLKNILGSNEYLIYDSIDSCDIILFLKSWSYNNGAQTIQNIDKNLYIKYSYSVLGFDSKKVHSKRYKDLDEKIDKITICGVIDNYSSFSTWYNYLLKKFECNKVTINSYGRLGNEDVVLNILNCSADKFFNYYSKKGSLLNYNNKLYNESLILPRIHFDNSYTDFDTLKKGSDSYGLKWKKN